MIKKKDYMIIIYTILALLIDLLGRIVADRLMLPLWLDSVGTFIIAYIEGPICGAVVGLSNNIIYGIFVENQTVYCIVGALIGFFVGYISKRKVFESQFKTMTLGVVLAVFSALVAVVINIFVYGGVSGNVWANQTALFFADLGIPKAFSNFIGQFYVEFLDKLVCVEIIYIMLKIRTLYRNKKLKKMKNLGVVALTLGVFSLGMLNVSAENSPLTAVEGDVAECASVEEFSIDYDDYVQTVYSNNEGLLPSEANDIEQTKDGKLWIGTYAGLFKYNGSKFTLFGDVDSVKNVNCLYTDKEGRLWIGTNDDGVTIFINENVANVINEDHGLMSNSVKDILSDSVGNYYIGTSEGISIVSLSGGVKIIKSYDYVKNVVCMTADGKGNVVVITDRGELFWLKDGEMMSDSSDGIETTGYSSALFVNNDTLLLGTPEGEVMIYNTSSEVPKLERSIKPEGIIDINSFYIKDNSEIFVCSDTGIAVISEDYSYHVLNTNNFTSSIDNMLIDYQGNMWFSSSRLGLLKMSKTPFVEVFSKIGETSVVNSTENWRDLLYCGTDDGLVVVDESSGKEVFNEITELLKGVRVRCLKTDRKNNLWIATTGMGVYKIRADVQGVLEIKNFTEDDGMPNMRFRNIYELQDGRIAVCGDYGVAIISDNSVQQTFNSQNGLVNEKSLCLLEYNNSVYVGSDGGGISVISDGKVVEHIGRDDELMSEVILRMVYDPSTDGVFIVTSKGLCYMSPDGKITALTNFPYSNNYDMVCSHDGACWILGSAGIYVADSSELIRNESRDYSLLNSKKGFRSSLTANAWLCKEDETLYLCCSDGVVKINMSMIDSYIKSYRMILNNVLIDGEKHEINRSDVLKIDADAEKIVFSPEVLNYSMNDPYVSYYLEGHDKKETVCLLSELENIVYTHIKPGKYVFRLAILDNLNGEVVESASFTIEKEIKMYQNGWFTLYIVLISALLLIWVTWFITRIRTQRTLLRQRYELEYAKKQIEMGNETILSIARAVDAKDTNTSEHSFRVSQYSVAIAKELGYPEKKYENLRQMALLHDIGKIGVPDAILNKPAKLTAEEYEIMKSHVIKGGEILKDFTIIDNVSVGALYHHEKYDGTGYCHGLKGEEIPLDARIIGIADAFDAMTANRVYRKRLNLDEVISELKRCSGTQFDPKLVEIMLSLIENKTIDVEELYNKSKEKK